MQREKKLELLRAIRNGEKPVLKHSSNVPAISINRGGGFSLPNSTVCVTRLEAASYWEKHNITYFLICPYNDDDVNCDGLNCLNCNYINNR